MKPLRNHERSLGLLLAALGLFAILALTLTPQPPAQRPAPHFCVICGDRGTADSILNILLFAPFGAGLALMGVTRGRTTVVGFLVSSCIEIAQFAIVPGREANTGDVVMNTLGALLAWIVARHWRQWLFPSARTARALGIGGSVAWLLTLTAAAMAMKPAPSRDGFFVQIKPAIPTEERRFPGDISGASLDGITLFDGPLPDSSTRVRAALLRGSARFDAILRPLMSPPPWPAILVRIVDHSQHTELQLTQSGDRLVFEPRLKAGMFRLDPPVVRLDGVFPISPAQPNCGNAETMLVYGQHADGYLVAGAVGNACRREIRAPLRPTLGWMLLLPFQYAIGPEAWLYSAVWVFALVVVWSYWMGSTKLQYARLVAEGVFVLATGLGAIPMIFDAPPSAASEWTAGLLGFALGLTMGRRAAQLREFAPTRSHNG